MSFPLLMIFVREDCLFVAFDGFLYGWVLLFHFSFVKSLKGLRIAICVSLLSWTNYWRPTLLSLRLVSSFLIAKYWQWISVWLLINDFISNNFMKKIIQILFYALFLQFFGYCPLCNSIFFKFCLKTFFKVPKNEVLILINYFT